MCASYSLCSREFSFLGFPVRAIRVCACNMCTGSGNGTQEWAVEDLLSLVDLYLVYLILFQLRHCL